MTAPTLTPERYSCECGYSEHLRILSCHHIFCSRCLCLYRLQTQIQCPICHQITILDEIDGILGLPLLDQTSEISDPSDSLPESTPPDSDTSTSFPPDPSWFDGITDSTLPLPSAIPCPFQPAIFKTEVTQKPTAYFLPCPSTSVHGLIVNHLRSIWFSPSDFYADQIEYATPHLMFVPFIVLSFNAITHFVKEPSLSSSTLSASSNLLDEQQTANFSTVDDEDNVVYSRTYLDTLLSAAREPHTNPNLQTLISQIDDWNLQGKTFSPSNSDLRASVAPKTYESIWKNHVDLIRDEHASHFPRSPSTEFVTETNDREYRFVYFPIYLSSYRWRDAPYYVVVNAQSGKVYCQRPYGTGTIGTAANWIVKSTLKELSK